MLLAVNSANNVARNDGGSAALTSDQRTLRAVEQSDETGRDGNVYRPAEEDGHQDIGGVICHNVAIEVRARGLEPFEDIRIRMIELLS